MRKQQEGGRKSLQDFLHAHQESWFCVSYFYNSWSLWRQREKVNARRGEYFFEDRMRAGRTFILSASTCAARKSEGNSYGTALLIKKAEDDDAALRGDEEFAVGDCGR